MSGCILPYLYITGNPKNGGSGHTLCLNVVSQQGTEDWQEFLNELSDRWRQIPGVRFHWAKQWSMLHDIDTIIREVSILSLNTCFD